MVLQCSIMFMYCCCTVCVLSLLYLLHSVGFLPTVGIKYLNKRKYCVGTEPSALVYIGILVTSTTTGHDGSVVSTLASQAKGRGSIPSCGTSFFPTCIFYLPFPTSVEKVIEQTIHQFGRILSGDATPT